MVSFLKGPLKRLAFKVMSKLNCSLKFQKVLNFELVKMILKPQVVDLKMHVYEIRYFDHFLPQTFYCQKYLLFMIFLQENALLELIAKFSRVFLIPILNAYFAFIKSLSWDLMITMIDWLKLKKVMYFSQLLKNAENHLLILLHIQCPLILDSNF